ncbi:MAG: hypothetical protein AAF366_08280 [Pseudomonadota bacterium]
MIQDDLPIQPDAIAASSQTGDPGAAFEDTLVAQTQTGRPVDPVPPGRQPTIGGPNPGGQGIAGGISILINAINGLRQMNEMGRAREGLEASLTTAIDQLETAADVRGPGQFVELRMQYRDAGGVNDFEGIVISETRDLSRADQPEFRAPLPPGVSEYVVRIHNLPNSDVPGMVGLDQARADLARLQR